MLKKEDGSWFALYVRSCHEKVVEAQLAAKDQNVFLPVYATKRKWADRWKSIALPLFPGYVFCKFVPEKRASVLATSGVVDLVRVGLEPAPIEDVVIDQIRRIAESSLLAEPYEGLLAGEEVMMCGGPLSGLTGTLMEVRKGLRMVVSVQLLQRSIAVEIDREWVVPRMPIKRAYSDHLGPKAHVA
jgi:transcription antitermination factor NusG